MFGKEIHECTPIFMGHVDMSGEGISMRPIGDPSGEIFDIILCSFLCFMCSTGRLTVKCLEICELWYVAYMLAYASVLYLTICRITWSLWLGTRGLTKLGLKLMS